MTRPTNRRPTNHPQPHHPPDPRPGVGEHGVSERGTVSVLFAVLGLSLLMATGLVVDGGRRLGALAEARHLADNAARAGAQALDTDTYRRSGAVVVDPGAAAARVDAYLSVLGHTGTTTVDGPIITVHVELRVATRFLPGPLYAAATESATAVLGITEAR